MTDQELKRLSRKDLLELLISQGRERDALQSRLEKTRDALQERQLRIAEAGSLAEAALQLNGVFEAAQAAAGQYLDNLRFRSQQVEEDCAKREAACIKRETESKEMINRQREEAARAAKELEEETQQRCRKLEEETQES